MDEHELKRRVEELDCAITEIFPDHGTFGVTEYDRGYAAGLVQTVGWLLGKNAMHPIKLVHGQWDLWRAE